MSECDESIDLASDSEVSKPEFRLNELVEIKIPDTSDVELASDEEDDDDELLKDGSAIWGSRSLRERHERHLTRVSEYKISNGDNEENQKIDEEKTRDAKIWRTGDLGVDVGTVGAMRYQRQTRRRHYKKDSRFIRDLYVVCYDENETTESMCPEVSSK